MNSTIRNRQLLQISPTISRQAKEVPSLMENPSSAELTGTSYKTNCAAHRIEVDLSLTDANGKKQKIELTWPFKAFRGNQLGANDVQVKIHTNEPEPKNPHLEKFQADMRRNEMKKLSINDQAQRFDHSKRQDAFQEDMRLRSGSWSPSQTISALDLPAAVRSTLISVLSKDNPTNTHNDYLKYVKPEVEAFKIALSA